MPIVPQPGAPQTGTSKPGVPLEQAFNRARAHLGDQGAQIWTDTKLAEFAKEAYTWVFNEVAIFSDPAIEKVTPDPGVQYTAGATPGAIQSLISIQPVDMLVPIRVDFRLNANEDWSLVNRVDRLRSFVNNVPQTLHEWEWRGRQIWVPSMGSTGNTPDGYLRFRYQALFPPIQFASDQILFDNVVEAIGGYMAMCAARSRGQHAQAQAFYGSLDPPPGFGAVCFLDRCVRILVMNDQYTPRRGRSFSGGGSGPSGGSDFAL